MNKLLIALLLVSLTGCASFFPVKQKWPDAPATLMVDSPNLATVELDPTLNLPTITLSDIMKTVAKNYSTYYTEREKLRGWHEWYAEQKKIHDELNK